MFILLTVIAFAVFILFILVYKSIKSSNGDKYWGYIATLFSILISPFVQNYFFDKQNKENRDLANKQYKNNIDAGFSQRIYIYQYDELKEISKNLLDFYELIQKINNIRSELHYTLNPIWLNKNMSKEEMKTENYDDASLIIKDKMKNILSLSIKANNRIEIMHDNITLSEINKKDTLNECLQNLKDWNHFFKQEGEVIPLNIDGKYQKDKKGRNYVIDQSFKNMEVASYSINIEHKKCLKEINKIKEEIKNNHMK